jgi:hypothetical protein
LYELSWRTDENYYNVRAVHQQMRLGDKVRLLAYELLAVSNDIFLLMSSHIFKVVLNGIYIWILRSSDGTYRIWPEICTSKN